MHYRVCNNQILLGRIEMGQVSRKGCINLLGTVYKSQWTCTVYKGKRKILNLLFSCEGDVNLRPILV